MDTPSAPEDLSATRAPPAGALGIAPSCSRGGAFPAQAHGAGEHTFPEHVWTLLNEERCTRTVRQIPGDSRMGVGPPFDERLQDGCSRPLDRCALAISAPSVTFRGGLTWRTSEEGVALYPERDPSTALVPSSPGLRRPLHPGSPSCLRYHADIYPGAVRAFPALFFLA